MANFKLKNKHNTISIQIENLFSNIYTYISLCLMQLHYLFKKITKIHMQHLSAVCVIYIHSNNSIY